MQALAHQFSRSFATAAKAPVKMSFKKLAIDQVDLAGKRVVGVMCTR
jgi:hypothetical protein